MTSMGITPDRIEAIQRQELAQLAACDAPETIKIRERERGREGGS